MSSPAFIDPRFEFKAPKFHDFTVDDAPDSPGGAFFADGEADMMNEGSSGPKPPGTSKRARARLPTSNSAMQMSCAT